MLLWRGYLSFGKKKQYKNNMDEGGLICKKSEADIERRQH
jgi:hypothetical protein